MLFSAGLNLRAEGASLDTVLAEKILSEINQARIENGAEALVSDQRLIGLAQQWAKKQTMKHRTHLSTVQKANGLSYLNECIYRSNGNPTASRVVNAWLKSKGHRKGILTSKAKLGGVGVFRSKSGWVYVVFNGGAR